LAPGARFLLGCSAGMLSLILVVALLLLGLDLSGRLSAPAFANRLSFDEKLRHLRAHPPQDVEVLLIGSSTTLHGIDGGVLRERLGIGGEVVNLGVQGLRLHQSRWLAEAFLPRWRGITHVMMVSTLSEYAGCEEGGRFFRAEHVLAYLGGRPELLYHFRYLNLAAVLRRAPHIPQLRRTRAELDAISFAPDGSLPLEVPRERVSERVWQGEPISLDASCYRALRQMALDLQRQGKRFALVVAPLRPGFLARRDPEGLWLAEHLRRLRAALDGTGASLIDAHAALDLPEEVFFDAYHVNGGMAPVLTRLVGDRLRGGPQRHEAASGEPGSCEAGARSCRRPDS
jgi:hypothetical protein